MGKDVRNVQFGRYKVVSVDVGTCLTNRLATYNMLFDVLSTPLCATTTTTTVGSVGPLVFTVTDNKQLSA